MSVAPRLHDPQRPGRPELLPFGMAPIGLRRRTWTGSDGRPEHFRDSDGWLWIELAHMLKVGGFTSPMDLAARADLGPSAVYGFLHRLERSGLASLVRDESDPRKIVDVMPRYSTGYHADALAELEKGRATPRGRAQVRTGADPVPDVGARTCEPGRAQTCTGARAPARAPIYELKGEEFESNDSIRSLALPDPEDPDPPDPPGPIAAADALGETEAIPDDAATDPAAAAATPPGPGEPPAAPEDFEPTAEDLARFEVQARQPGGMGRIARNMLELHRAERALRERRRAGIEPPPPAEPAPTPVMTRWAAPAAPARDAPVDFETLLRRVANRESFGDEVVDDAARVLAGKLDDRAGLPFYRRVMADLRAGPLAVRGPLTVRDVLAALRCARGEVGCPGAAFNAAIGRARSKAPPAARKTGPPFNPEKFPGGPAPKGHRPMNH